MSWNSITGGTGRRWEIGGTKQGKKGGGTKEWIITKVLRERMKNNIKDKYMGKSKDKTITMSHEI